MSSHCARSFQRCSDRAGHLGKEVCPSPRIKRITNYKWSQKTVARVSNAVSPDSLRICDDSLDGFAEASQQPWRPIWWQRWWVRRRCCRIGGRCLRHVLRAYAGHTIWNSLAPLSSSYYYMMQWIAPLLVYRKSLANNESRPNNICPFTFPSYASFTVADKLFISA